MLTIFVQIFSWESQGSNQNMSVLRKEIVMQGEKAIF